jgi:hypothetical protein
VTETEATALLRQWLDDKNAPYLWSDAVLLDAIQASMSEVAERSRGLAFTVTAELEIDEPSVTLELPTADPGVTVPLIAIDIRTVLLEGSTAPLKQRSEEWLDTNRSGWREETGTPYEYVLEDNGTLTLYPTPDAVLTLTVKGYRTTTATDALSVIPERYHRDLLHWAMYECYSNSDPEGEASVRAQQQLQLFERAFGPRKSAVWDRVNRSLPAGAIGVSRRIA